MQAARESARRSSRRCRSSPTERGAVNLGQASDSRRTRSSCTSAGASVTRARRQEPVRADDRRVPALREATAQQGVGRLFTAARSMPRAEVTVTSGATEALFAAVHAVVRPGEEVIVLDPCYDSYEPADRARRRAHSAPEPLVGAGVLGVDLAARRRCASDRAHAHDHTSTRRTYPTGATLSSGDLDTSALTLLRRY